MSSFNQINLYAYVKAQKEVIENYIENLATYGQQPGGGIIRPVYSAPWQEAQQKLAGWMQEIGLSLRYDAVGNLWGRLEGRENGPAIASGSHLDTVKEGGKYDGALGVLAALSAVRFLKELYGTPRLPLEVLVLCEEEGSRFSSNFLGSRTITGGIEYAELERVRDAEGMSIVEAARACGFEPEKLAEAYLKDLGGFLELHIEQGRLLDDAKLQVGVVKDITGIQQLKVVFKGRADHAGTTPMNLRNDALVAAAEAISRLNTMARELGHPAVATVGMMTVEPGARNIVPAQVEISVDFRHSDATTKAQMAAQIRSIIEEAAVRQGVEVNLEVTADRAPAPMTPFMVETVQAAADELGLTSMPMVSGAGHDSQVMVELTPTAMIFVPSRDGRSHSAAEYTPMDEILPGIAVLAQALYKLAY